ncbi:hypothetical protein [Terricaulis silvestris]|uniref:Uncharacterized protein n=1 Tax=Terricaulis silvestris TaxID=2686094 RepID=A0A6I6MQ75_9CAUL|nr:hypothetical protein [Terricaulis silvestris]QGZ95546.1 hypothetical protein DSM104635_02396 [Terricaulis silvestris]
MSWKIHAGVLGIAAFLVLCFYLGALGWVVFFAVACGVPLVIGGWQLIDESGNKRLGIRLLLLAVLSFFGLLGAWN